MTAGRDGRRILHGPFVEPSDVRTDRVRRVVAARVECDHCAMLKIREIDHLVLRVNDLDRMLSFYCDVVGCTVERRQDEIGLIQLRAGRSLIDLVPVDGALGRAGGAGPGSEGRNLDHLCLRLETFDGEAIRAHLAAHSVQAGDVSSRYGAEGEGPSIYIHDPEGNVVELKGPPWES